MSPKLTHEEQWRAWLTGTHPIIGQQHRLFSLLPGTHRCKFCNAPFHSPWAPLLRLIGKGPSNKNPRFCKL